MNVTLLFGRRGWAVCVCAMIFVACERSLTDEDGAVFAAEQTETPTQDLFFGKYYASGMNPHVIPRPRQTQAHGRSLSGLVDAVRQDLEAQNAADPFMDDMIAYYGFPFWDYGTVLDSAGTEIAVIPVAKLDGAVVTAVILATEKPEGLRYHFVKKPALPDTEPVYRTKGFFIHALSYLSAMDRAVFGVIDHTLSHLLAEELEVSGIGQEHGGAQTRTCYLVTTYYTPCTDWFQITDSDWEYLDTQCRSYQVTVTICDDTSIDDVNPPGGQWPTGGGTTDISSEPDPDEIEDIQTLQLHLDLDFDRWRCIRENDELRGELMSLVESGVYSPCGGDLVGDTDLIERAINTLGNDDCTVPAFYNALENWDAIIPSTNLDKHCPAFACILEEMVNGSLGTKFVCDLLRGFDGSQENNEGKGFHIYISPVDFSASDGFDNDSYAGVADFERFPGSSNALTMAINLNRCNDMDNITVFETLQHEFIHADIKRRLFEYHGWDGADETEADAFHRLVLAEYGGQAGVDEHRLMLEYYIQQMIDSLIEMNNGMGTYDDFIGLVLNGFPENVLNYCGITHEDVAEAYSHFISFINTPGNSVNTALNSC